MIWNEIIERNFITRKCEFCVTCWSITCSIPPSPRYLKYHRVIKFLLFVCVLFFLSRGTSPREPQFVASASMGFFFHSYLNLCHTSSLINISSTVVQINSSLFLPPDVRKKICLVCPSNQKWTPAFLPCMFWLDLGFIFLVSILHVFSIIFLFNLGYC